MTRRRLLVGFAAILLFALIPSVAAEEAILDGDKPLVLMVYDSHCKKWCGEVRPILHELKEQYGDKVVFYELDFSEKEMKQSYETARRLGVGSFIKGVIDWIPTVGIFTTKRRTVKELPGLKKKTVYIEGIEKALKSN